MDYALTRDGAPTQHRIDRVRHWPGIIRLWMRRARTRRTLKHLDADQLADIGITRTQALAEAQKPFWIR